MNPIKNEDRESGGPLANPPVEPRKSKDLTGWLVLGLIAVGLVVAWLATR